MLTKEFDQNKLRDVLQQKAVISRRPLSCTFELTYRCNFSCPMCYVRMTDEQAKPYGRLRTVDEWLDMARQVYDSGVLYLNLTGGECTAYNGFVRLYEEVSKMGFRASLMTNAGAYSPSLLKLFEEYPPYGVAVSLYGGSNETYKKVTGDPNGLDKVLSNIKFFRSIGVPVTLNYTMTKQNVLDYPKVGNICKELGIPYTLITDITPHARNSSYSDCSCALSPSQRACIACHTPEEVELALCNAEILEKEIADYSPPVAVNGGVTEVQGCIGSYSAAAIFWNGDMNSCVSLAGSACYKPFETGFENAWQQMQKDHSKRFALPPVCKNCDMREDCIHSCAARNFEATGDYQTPDPNTCLYVWLLRKYRTEKGREITVNPPSCM